MINLGMQNWDAFIARAAERITNPPLRGAEDVGTSWKHGKEWHMMSLEEAVNMAQYGWPDGTKQIAKTLDTLPPDDEALPDWNMDVSGSICNVPAYLAGEPECMWRMSECKRSERRVSLIVQAHVPSKAAVQEVMNYAISVAAIVRSLEASGINVSIYSLMYTRGAATEIDLGYGSVVKEFGEPMDLAKIAFAMHPVWFRRIHFAWQERTEDAIRAGLGGHSYGYANRLNREVAMEIIGQDVGNVVVLPSVIESMDLFGLRSLSSVLENLRMYVANSLERLQ